MKDKWLCVSYLGQWPTSLFHVIHSPRTVQVSVRHLLKYDTKTARIEFAGQPYRMNNPRFSYRFPLCNGYCAFLCMLVGVHEVENHGSWHMPII